MPPNGAGWLSNVKAAEEEVRLCGQAERETFRQDVAVLVKELGQRAIEMAVAMK